MRGLVDGGRLKVMHGAPGKLLATIRTCLRSSPDYLHYDWTYSYFVRRYRPLSWLLGVVFVVEVLAARHLFGCRIVWTLHNIESHEPKHRRLERWVHRRLAKQCKWIRVMSPSLVEQAARYLSVDPDAVRPLPEGSYVGYYANQVSRSEARNKLGILDDATVLLSIGSIRPYKGIEQYLAVVAKIEDPRVCAVIAGPCRIPELAQRIQDIAARDRRIRLLLRYLLDDELQYYFNASDIVVLPFDEITNSGSVILAMGYAKPIVAPSLGAIPHRLQQQKELLYNPGELENAIRHALSMNHERLESLGKLNLATVQEHDWRRFQDFF